MILFIILKTDRLSNEFIETIAVEVEEFFSNFSDNPIQISQWAHHYFCKDDGGLLVFDSNKPMSIHAAFAVGHM